MQQSHGQARLFAGNRHLLVLALVVLAALAGCGAPPLRDAAAVPDWQTGAPLPVRHGELAMSATPRVVDGERIDHVAVVGGIRRLGRTLDTVFFYDPERDAWHEGPALPAPRHHTTAASLDGALYVSGGAPATFGRWTPETNLWRLEPDADAWEALEPMPEGRHGHRLVAWEGRLYAIGGMGPGSDVLIYAPGEGWSRGAPLPEMRDHLSVVVAGDEIWAIGGRVHPDSLARVDIYDPAADAWRDGPDLPDATSGAAEGLMGGMIYVFGGEQPAFFTGEVFDRHWRIDPQAETPQWQPAEPPIRAMHGVEGAVLDGRFYLAGGAYRHGAFSVFGWSDLVQIRER